MTVAELSRDLVQILKEETSVYHQLIEILRKEKKCLTGLILEGIHSSASGKEVLALKVKSLEEARELILSNISSLTGVRKDLLSISFISSLTDLPLSSELLDFKDVLLDLIGEVKILNQQNGVLLANSSRMVGDSMEFLRQYLCGKSKESYRPRSKRRSSNTTSSILNGAIISRQI